MKDISKEMMTRIGEVKQVMNPIYLTLLLNKVASALPINFLLNIYKIKQRNISIESSQQFLYDIQNEMKDLLILMATVGNTGPSESYKTFVNTSILKIVGRFKVMGYPGEHDAIREGY